MSQLVYFQAVAESGLIADAAKKLQVTGPAVSIALSKLEKELDVVLFSRIRNRLELTAQGRIFYERVNQILSDIETATEKLKNLDVST